MARPILIGIYKIVSPSKRVYIGQAFNIYKRWVTYRGNPDKYKQQTLLYHSMLKYGHKKHTFEIVEQCTKEELDKKEDYYIELFQCFNSKHGLNLKRGGAKGSLSDESKKKISESKKGDKNCWFGKKFSDEHRKKIGDANRGKKITGERLERLKASAKKRTIYHKHTQATKDKISFAFKGEKHPMWGKKASAETRKKQSEAKKGEKSHLWGKQFSEATRNKIRNYALNMSEEHKRKLSIAQTGKTGTLNGRSRKVVQISLDGVEIKVWDSMGDIMRSTGIKNKNVWGVCAGRQKTAGGFKWKYYNDTTT